MLFHAKAALNRSVLGCLGDPSSFGLLCSFQRYPVLQRCPSEVSFSCLGPGMPWASLSRPPWGPQAPAHSYIPAVPGLPAFPPVLHCQHNSYQQPKVSTQNRKRTGQRVVPEIKSSFLLSPLKIKWCEDHDGWMRYLEVQDRAGILKWEKLLTDESAEGTTLLPESRWNNRLLESTWKDQVRQIAANTTQSLKFPGIFSL